MMAFPKDSAFFYENQKRHERLQELVKMNPNSEGLPARLAKHDLPLEHWHHDLVTVYQL